MVVVGAWLRTLLFPLISLSSLAVTSTGLSITTELPLMASVLRTRAFRTGDPSGFTGFPLQHSSPRGGSGHGARVGPWDPQLQ